MSAVKKKISSYTKDVIWLYLKIISKKYKTVINCWNILYRAIRKRCVRNCFCLLSCFPLAMKLMFLAFRWIVVPPSSGPNSPWKEPPLWELQISYVFLLFSTTHCSILELIVRSGLDVPTFATRRLHECHPARAPSGGRWNRGREMPHNFA